MSDVLAPLTWNVPIVDSNGLPTTEFMRKWEAQRNINATGGISKIYVDTRDASTLRTAEAYTDAHESVSANPSATAKDTAVNGSATTFMRSDAAPAVQKTSASLFGLAKVDDSTITASGGVITAVSATALANFHPGFQSGRAYGCPLGAVSTQSSTTNTLYAVPFFCGSAHTFTKIQINGSTTHTGNCEFGIYANSSGIPGAKIRDFGSVATANTAYGFTGQSIVLSAGIWYWLAAGFSATGDTATWLDASSTAPFTAYLLGASDATLSVNSLFVSGAWTFSANNLPDPFPTVARVRFCPNVMLTA